MLVFLLALVIAAGTGFFVEIVAGGAIDRAVSAFRDLIGGWQPDAWPRGVQEEDRDRPWGSGTVAPAIQGLAEGGARGVAIAHVRGRTRSR